MGEGRGSFFLCVSLGFDSGLGFSEVLVLVQVTHTRQGHLEGNLNPNQDIFLHHSLNLYLHKGRIIINRSQSWLKDDDSYITVR
jgi:hypothetical protein